MTADTLREKFLAFFKSKKHKILESDSLVPAGDPTILFTPAGMNQFKKEFLGFDSGFKRAATSQRCLRMDDLERVGKTRGHHTFFEMLGNFSFGDYFKDEAISWAWEFLTQELKIPAAKLWISVYRDDGEALKIWRDKIKVPAQHIIKLGDKENFWPSEAKEKGPNGPCGPCSEIFFDWGKEAGCGKTRCSPACSCGRFVEVWNLVFTQFNRKVGGVLEPLPNKNIDTGMGLERLAAVMQGVQSNFQTDLFQPIIKEINSGIGLRVTGNVELVYAVADHIRAIAFSIYDGVLPSNETRGYVVRKLIRKCALHLGALGFKQPFLYKLVPVVSQIMQRSYPQLLERKENIAEIILAEEKNFQHTLNSSGSLFQEKFGELLKKADPLKAGKIAFQLYDTHGIPFELTKSWLNKNKIEISQETFEQELNAQKSRSKSQSAMKGDVFGIKNLDLGIKETKFLGYKDCAVRAKILKIVKDNQEIKKASQGQEISIVLDKTVFYAEAGGQAADTGELVKAKNVFLVMGAQKAGNAILHIGRVKEGSFKKSDLVTAKINSWRRLAIARNHTATHLLQAALRKVLGTHVQQQGSLVAEDRLRFDFTHFKDVDKPTLDRIEAIVNEYIMRNFPLNTQEMPLSEAKKKGALAFFGEKYSQKVKVVAISDVSSELCGGTHLQSTGQIGLFKIIQEGSVASGIRRIEAITGEAALKAIKEEEVIIANTASVLGVAQDKIIPELEKRIAQIKSLEKQLHSRKLDNAKLDLDALIKNAQVIKDIKLITRVMEDLDMDILRKTADLIKQKTENAVIALGSKSDDKALLVMAVTADLVNRGADVSQWIRQVAAPLGGSGGGRKDFAQAGGTKPENFEKSFEELKNLVEKL